MCNDAVDFTAACTDDSFFTSQHHQVHQLSLFAFALWMCSGFGSQPSWIAFVGWFRVFRCINKPNSYLCRLCINAPQAKFQKKTCIETFVLQSFCRGTPRFSTRRFQIHNLLQGIDRHVQFSGTTHYEHSDNSNKCVEKMRLVGMWALIIMILCLFLQQLFQFSYHHTTFSNILENAYVPETSRYSERCCISTLIQNPPTIYLQSMPFFRTIMFVNTIFGIAPIGVPTWTCPFAYDMNIHQLHSIDLGFAVFPASCHSHEFETLPLCTCYHNMGLFRPLQIGTIPRKVVITVETFSSHQNRNAPNFPSKVFFQACQGILNMHQLPCDIRSRPQDVQWIKRTDTNRQHVLQDSLSSMPRTWMMINPQQCLFSCVRDCVSRWSHAPCFTWSEDVVLVCNPYALLYCIYPQHYHSRQTDQNTSCKLGDQLYQWPASRQAYRERFRRIGEAQNPGPKPPGVKQQCQHLNIYHSNPTSLVGKENHYDHMLDGIHLIAETSATQTAQRICTARFRHKKLACLWSHPMTAYKQSSSNLRGHAGGTAIIAPFPMHRGLEPIPSYLQKADRFVDGVVQYYPHLYMYCATVYGPHINHRYCNPRTIMNQIMNFVAQKGLRYQGPACIAGDFNCPLSDIECWPSLQAAGWVDAAELSAQQHHRPLDTTSNENARHSFILCNRQLAAGLIECKTIKHHLFSVHPVLHAKFDYEVARQSYIQWKIPKSFDRFLIDSQAAEQFVNQQFQKSQSKHDLALSENNIGKLSQYWTELAEQTLANAVVDVEGKPLKVRPGHLGRAQGKHFVQQPAAMPIIPRPRQGDHQPISEQGSVELRRWGKQLHRLQSLVRQYQFFNLTNNPFAHAKLCALWLQIVEAKGFEGKFQSWILEHFEVYIPVELPDISYCTDLKNTFAKWYTTQEHAIWLQRTNLKQLEIVVDIPKGGKLAFQHLRDDAQPPIHAIHFEKEASIVRTKCAKEGTTCVKVQPGHTLTQGKIKIQDQEATIIQSHSNRILLDHKIKWKSTNLSIVQEDFTMNPASMHQQLYNAWAPYFCRDPGNEETQHWEDALKFLETIQDFPPMTSQPITGQQLYLAIKKTKLASSRGGDGFSTLDLRRLPIKIWDFMATIFHQIERNHLWPEAWTLAKTLCLPKSPMPKTPLDIRPITVMSKMYRVWGKIRGGQVATHLASHVPKTIGGPCAQISSELIALYTADRIEEAISSKTPLSGVVLDIIKCYNTIPRLPLQQLLCKLGIPNDIIHTFFAAMKQLQRFFQVCETCGPTFTTTTGIVEGCGFAVPCMLAIGIWANAVISVDNGDVEAVMFADNWSIFHEQPAQLVDVLKQLLAFVEAMKMRIAPKKSWLWSTSALHRTQLTRASRHCQHIPVINEAKDLGVDQNYTNKIVKKTWKSRLKKVQHKLKATSKSKIPRSFTKTIAINGALSCGSYGSVCTFVSKSDHKTLRSAIAKATRRSGTGANPWLACNAIQQGLDPQYRDLCSRFTTWKRYIRLFPERVTKMQDRFQQPLSTHKTITGRVASLRKAAQTMGMQTVLEDGGITCVYRHIRLPILTTPQKTLRQVLQRPWDRFVASNLYNRKDWRLPMFDSRINTIAYNKLQHREQALLDAVLTGKHITNELITKFQPKQDDKCVLCGQRDSRLHRFFHCPELASTRQQYASTLDSVKKWTNTQKLFALCPYQDGLETFFTETQCQEVEFTMPPQDGQVKHLFVDGTAFFNDHPWLVTAGAAVVISHPDTTSAKLITRKRVPGMVHNSYIGELYAILLALNHAWTVHIYSDCQTLVEEISYVCQTRTLPQQWSQIHPAIWNRIMRHIISRPIGNIIIQKVAAHQNWQNITQPDLRWQSYVNSRVDYHAKQAIITDNASSYQARNVAYKQQALLKQTVCEYYAYLAEISKIVVDKKPKKVQVVENQFDPHQEALQPCQHTVDNQYILNEPQMYKEFPWGPIFLWRLHTWAQHLRWSNHSGACHKDISDIELTVDFMLYTNSEPPINLSKGRETIWNPCKLETPRFMS